MRPLQLLFVSLFCLMLPAIGPGGVLAQESVWTNTFNEGLRKLKLKDFPGAEKDFRAALDASKKFKKHDFRVPETLVFIAQSLQGQGNTEEANVFANRTSATTLVAAEEIKKVSYVFVVRVQNEDKHFLLSYELEKSRILRLLGTSAGILANNRKFDEAEKIYLKAIELGSEISGRFFFIALYSSKESDEGEENRKNAKELEKDIVAHVFKVAQLYDQLGDLYFLTKQFEKAQGSYEKSLRLRETYFRTENPFSSVSNGRLAVLFSAQGHLDQAAPYFREAIRLLEKFPQYNLPERPAIYQNYYLFLKKTGRESEIPEVIARANRRAFPQNDPVKANLEAGRLSFFQYQFKDALQSFEKAFNLEKLKPVLSASELEELLTLYGYCLVFELSNEKASEVFDYAESKKLESAEILFFSACAKFQINQSEKGKEFLKRLNKFLKKAETDERGYLWDRFERLAMEIGNRELIKAVRDSR